MLRRSRIVLAIIATTCLVVASGGWMHQNLGPDEVRGRVLDPNNHPIAHLSVFLDRGDALIERYETDSMGVFQFTLWARTPHRATWLICAPGAVPIVAQPERDEFSRPGVTFHTYEVTLYRDSVWHFYRQSGWSGPLPRECPRAVDVIGWRYPASAGRNWGESTTEEPDWKRFPGPPSLPPSR